MYVVLHDMSMTHICALQQTHQTARNVPISHCDHRFLWHVTHMSLVCLESLCVYLVFLTHADGIRVILCFQVQSMYEAVQTQLAQLEAQHTTQIATSQVRHVLY